MVSFRFAIPLVLIASALVALAVSHLILLPREQQRTRQAVEETIRHELSRLQETFELLIQVTDQGQVRNVFASVGTLDGLEQGILVNDQGVVVGATRQEAIGMHGADAFGSAESLPENLLTERRMIIRPAGSTRLAGFAPVCGWSQMALRHDRCGYIAVLVDYSYDLYTDEVFYLEQLTVFGAASGVGALMMFLILHFGLTRRLDYLHSVVARFRAGNIWVRPEVSGRDELSQLSRELATMLDTIAANENDLRKVIRVIEQSPSAVTIVDAEGRIEYTNPAAWARYGASATEAGRIAPLFEYTEDDDMVRQALARALAVGDEWDGELQRSVSEESRDGEGEGDVMWDRITVHPLRDERGLITNFIISETDVSEFKRASAARTTLERQLRHVQKMETIGRLAGGVAHDFNNILTPIAGYTQMMLETVEEGSKNQRRLQRILSGVRRARDLVSQLLVVSRRGEQDVMPVRPQEPVREAVDLIRASVSADLRVEYAAAPDLWMVMADPSRLHQVVMNLCTNASQAIGKQAGLISVNLDNLVVDATGESQEWKNVSMNGGSAVLEAGRYVRLTIEDNGPGMPADVAERIFEPFFTTKKAEGGSGLGLAIVDGIISQLGGRVTVYSERGLGTAFRVYLPAVEGGVALEEKSDSVPGRGEGQRIILIDDEVDNLGAIGEYLRSQNYQVQAFADPIMGLEEVRQNPACADLVITDFAMPGMQGDQLALALKGIREGLPVVMISGFSSKVTQWNRESFGVDAFVPKPLDFNALLRTISDLLQGNDSPPKESPRP
jgi:PAS domain S-box-containing protein